MHTNSLLFFKHVQQQSHDRVCGCRLPYDMLDLVLAIQTGLLEIDKASVQIRTCAKAAVDEVYPHNSNASEVIGTSITHFQHTKVLGKPYGS